MILNINNDNKKKKIKIGVGKILLDGDILNIVIC